MWAKCGHGTPAGRRDTRFSPGIPGFLFVGRSAPTGIRTLTGTILSRLPLPIGLWGQAAGLPAATAAVLPPGEQRQPTAKHRQELRRRHLGTRSEGLEREARCFARFDRHDVATQQEVEEPVAEDADLALPGGNGETVVAAVHEPRGESLDGDSAGLERALAET